MEIVLTDMKDPCVRVEKELVPGPGGHPLEVAMVANHIIVRFKSGTTEAQALEVITTQSAVLVRKLRAPNTYLVSVPAISCNPPTTATVLALPAALLAFESHPRVQYAEPNYIQFADEGSTEPDYPKLWGLHNMGQMGGKVDADIDASEGWVRMSESPQIIVGIIDSGIDLSHPDLLASIWINAVEEKGVAGVDDDGNGYVDDVHGWDFYNGDSDPRDEDGHGTHVAGTIGADGHNGAGVVGVSWRASLVALKFMQSSAGTTADASDAVSYAASVGAKILSNSWGTYGESQTLKLAIQDAGVAMAGGILFVASAGNEGVDTDAWPHYPSAYVAENIIAVAASNDSDGRPGTSNYGLNSVDLAAPGVQIYSTILGSSYGYLDGTSMATAHVSGACALLWAQHPEATYSEIRSRLFANVDILPDFKGYCTTGGRLNLDKALAAN